MERVGQTARFDLANPRSNARLERCAAIADLRALARRRLPRPLFDFVDGGAGSEGTLRANERAFADLRLIPRYAVDVGRRTSATDILGYRAALPLILAPVGFAGLLFPDGEAAAARAALTARLPFCLSTNSVASLEDIEAAAGAADRWFQLYFLKDREWMHALVRRASESGYRTLCVTIDLPIAGRRARDIRNGFTVPLRPTLASAFHFATRLAWLRGALGQKMRIGNFEGSSKTSGFVSIAQHVASLFDPSASWDDIARLRETWRGPLVVKGVMHPDDARRALDIGVDGIVVSNHGGRQLEDAPSTLEMLPHVVAAAGGRTPVFIDGGVRRGVDIVKAIALGASACLIGRAFAWGLAAAGEAGVARALAILAAELDTALALLGANSPNELGEHNLWRGAAPAPSERGL
jgi:isopentenyl diphosphate isomerase/L-lactate dehydrogenase-like FMN-dependent dehydrogenase